MRLLISKSKINKTVLKKILSSEKPALVLLDLDDTISPRNTYHIAGVERRVIDILKAQAKVCLVTNNTRDDACRILAEELGIDYVRITGSLFTRKPFPFKVRRIIKSYGTHGESTLFIGDKILTDAGCAFLSGCGSCLLVDGIEGSRFISRKSKNALRRAHV